MGGTDHWKERLDVAEYKIQFMISPVHILGEDYIPFSHRHEQEGVYFS